MRHEDNDRFNSKDEKDEGESPGNGLRQVTRIRAAMKAEQRVSEGTQRSPASTCFSVTTSVVKGFLNKRPRY